MNDIKFYTLDENRNVVETDASTLNELLGNTKKRRVGWTEMEHYTVSTIFLGIDHRFSEDEGGDPIVFETMVFPKGSWLDVFCSRCCTWNDAEIEHAKAVEMWKNHKPKAEEVLN